MGVSGAEGVGGSACYDDGRSGDECVGGGDVSSSIVGESAGTSAEYACDAEVVGYSSYVGKCSVGGDVGDGEW